MKKIAVLLAFLLILPLFGCVTNGQIKNYNAGVEAFNSGAIETAKGYFEAAGSYGNAKSYLSAITEYENIYLDALRLFDAQEYPAARNSFSAITNFENAKEYVDFIDRLEKRYHEGQEAYEALDYPLAKERFWQAMGYADAETFVTSISKLEDNYHIAMSYLEEDSHLDALRALLKIGTAYRDTNEMIEEQYAFFDSEGLTPREYVALYIESHTEAGETISVPSLDFGETSFAARTSEDLMMTGGADANGRLKEVSFWIPDYVKNGQGEEKMNRMFAHCLHVFTVNRVDFEEFLGDIEEYLSGEKTWANYSCSVRHDGSGFTVLTAVRGED